MNPITKIILWRYSAPVTSVNFASSWLGFTQLLGNGNILITHITHGGSAFEVTPKKEIVWEWVNDNKFSSGRTRDTRGVKKIKEESIKLFLNQTF